MSDASVEVLAGWHPDPHGRQDFRCEEHLAGTTCTTADNSVVQIHEGSPEPLSSSILASALSVDTAVHDNRGLN